MARTKKAAIKRRNAAKKAVKGNNKAGKKAVINKKAPVKTGKAAAASQAKADIAVSPVRKSSRGKKGEEDSSQFETPPTMKDDIKQASPVVGKGRSTRSRRQESSEEESSPKTETSNYDSAESLEMESDDGAAVINPKVRKNEKAVQTRKTRARGRPANTPYRLETAAKIQRLKMDPKFSSINPQILGRVVNQFELDPVTPSVIVNTVNHKDVPRRTRVAWADYEVESLERGVAKHGTSWSKILNDQELQFQDRTQVDLKDKWRNMKSTRLYHTIPIRRFVLVNENHEPILTNSNAYHVFNNRWPADAAIKVATKTFMYPPDVTKVRAYLREVPAEGQEETPVVHVFDVWREYEESGRHRDFSNIVKFRGMKNVWVGHARKVCTERLITRQAVLNDLDGMDSK